jgi:rod shape-determining protein MreC
VPSRSVRHTSRLDTGLLLACGLLSVVALVLPAHLRDPIATGVRRSLLAPLLAVQQRTESLRQAMVARDVGLLVNAEVAERALRAPSLEEENRALRQLLGLAGRLRSGFVIAEAFHPTSLIDDFTISLSAGARAGVARYAPVVTPDGLVGMVESVDPSSSLAITWAHPDFRVSAISTDEQAFGIVQPHLVSGAERYLLELRGVPFRASLDSGALIVSSGLGANFPRGIAIGTVIGEIPTTERWARTYLLKPSVLPNTVSAVMLLTGERVEAGVGNAWTDGLGPDSAMRAIVAASDSAARVAALAELRARRLALEAAADSARADSVMAGLGPAPTVRPPSFTPGALPTVRPPLPADSLRRPPGDAP